MEGEKEGGVGDEGERERRVVEEGYRGGRGERGGRRREKKGRAVNNFGDGSLLKKWGEEKA